MFFKPDETTTDLEIFREYKPLRNHLSAVYLPESLRVLWSYSQLQALNKPLLPDIENPYRYQTATDLQFKGHVLPWEIEIMVKEAILNSDLFSGRKTLLKWEYFSNGVNKLKHLEETITKKYVTKENVLTELNRITQQQFPWQIGRPSGHLLIRYFLLFNTPDFNNIIADVMGMDVLDFYTIGMAFTGFYTEKVALNYPATIELGKISRDKVNMFLQHFCLDLQQIKEKISEEQQYNDKFVYGFNSLRKYPLIKMDHYGTPSIVCPLPTLLFWRFTAGLYYEICGAKGFDNAFGPSFQAYIGKALSRALKKTKYLPEEKYKVGKDQKRSVDWIIDGDSIIFTECKARRIALSAKEELESDALQIEIEKIAAMIIQVYKSIKDYKAGYYPHYGMNKKQIYPLVVTLEDWFLFGDKVWKLMRESVQRMMSTENLPLEWLDTMPYSVCSAEEFECLIQVIDLVGVEPIFSNKVRDEDKTKWLFDPYLRHAFPKEYSLAIHLFQKEWDNLANTLTLHASN